MTNLLKLLINLSAGGTLIVCGSFILSRSLEGISAGKMLDALKKAGQNSFCSFAASALITAAIQSSSAITALTVSLAESGIMSLSAAMAAVYGANIGTTITAQIMSLDISAWWLYMLLAGVALGAISFIKTEFRCGAGVVIALGLLFMGLRTLTLSAPLFRKSEYIMNYLDSFGDNPLYGVFFGFISTALVHSSSATVGLTIALFSGGIIQLEQAVAIMLGDNIGTCMTAQVAAITSGQWGRRVAWGHTLYNVICALIALVFMEAFLKAVRLVTAFAGQSDLFLIANAHTLLNVLGAFLFLPLNKWFCGLLELIVRDDGP